MYLDRIFISMTNILFSLVNLYLSKNIKPDIIISDVKELSPDKIDELVLLGVKGLVIDLDETLRFDCMDIPLCNIEWLEMVKTKLKIIVLSNGHSERVNMILQQLHIDYIYFAMKPMRGGFKKALRVLGLQSSEVFVLGNDYFTDIFGGKRNMLFTCLVDCKLEKKLPSWCKNR